ncbi:hypothetical protein MKJ01_02475 [Chryseobacterium sp. SSA4.19]|uniref:hypothetical protein n=1 Tax=Chryseobacterium sp. SSA4.19 TaxID=2919915 RepID=UPI001F4DC91E|nr:hypothetical protein [Chryseobacterium sp. SSA4.19]MCJ8152626.1 hypothetical protein [Chryseobacterium sp. SSA4.19]
MEIPNHNSDMVFDEDLYTIDWSDIENTEADYEHYINDIETFFRQDIENEAFEEDLY